METLFKKVLCNEKLPDKDGRYFVLVQTTPHTKEGLYTAVYINKKFAPDNPRFLLANEIIAWLEEIEAQPDTEQFSKGYEQGLEHGKQLSDWISVEDQPIPKDGKEYLTVNINQGGVQNLISFNTIHKYFQSKGEYIGEHNAGTHWTLPLPPPETNPQK